MMCRQQCRVEALPASGNVCGIAVCGGADVFSDGLEAGARIELQAGNPRRTADQFSLRNQTGAAGRGKFATGARKLDVGDACIAAQVSG